MPVVSASVTPIDLSLLFSYDAQQSAKKLFDQMQVIYTSAEMKVFGDLTIWDNTMDTPPLSAQIN